VSLSEPRQIRNDRELDQQVDDRVHEIEAHAIVCVALLQHEAVDWQHDQRRDLLLFDPMVSIVIALHLSRCWHRRTNEHRRKMNDTKILVCNSRGYGVG